MALEAQFGSALEWEHSFVLRAVGPVTAEALYGKVLVPFVLDLFSYRMG